jgi:hypothetical protein
MQSILALMCHYSIFTKAMLTMIKTTIQSFMIITLDMVTKQQYLTTTRLVIVHIEVLAVVVFIAFQTLCTLSLVTRVWILMCGEVLPSSFHRLIMYRQGILLSISFIYKLVLNKMLNFNFYNNNISIFNTYGQFVLLNMII